MNHSTSIIISASLALLSILSCSRSSSREVLNDVESFIHNDPDSAISVLSKIDKSKLSSQRLQADYILLNTVALEESYRNLPVADEVTMKKAADFFDEKGPEDKKAQAFYYLGRIQYKTGNPGGAMVSFMKAEKAS